MPFWRLVGVRTILRIAVVIASLGFVVSVGIHLRSLVGQPLRSDEMIIFHTGIFIVALPYLWVVRYFQKEQNLKIVPIRHFYRGCPLWLRKLVIGLFVYYLVVMLVFLLKTHGDRGIAHLEQWAPPAVAVFFSCGWAVFYSALFAIYYSALKTIPWPLRCPNGHRVPPGRGYCEACGALVKPR